jgi:hypothetical protein
MPSIKDTKMMRPPSAKTAAGVAIAALLALGMFAGSAQARWGDRDDHRGYDHGYNGGYYRAPPVVYGGPYGGSGYYPPPVVYAPGIGVSLPGVNIGIR